MKVVKHEDFLRLPSGTVFCEFEPMCFGQLCIKKDTIVHADGSCLDFFFTPLTGDDVVSSEDKSDTLERSLEHGYTFFPYFKGLERQGKYNKSQLYIVWEPKDLMGLVIELLGAIGLRL